MCKLHISLDVADEISRLMSNFSNIEQDIVYYYLQSYTQKEIGQLMAVTRYRVETTIHKFKALGKAEMCAISG
jgi:DNA-directed RNA polymerase specialized sigma subunit